MSAVGAGKGVAREAEWVETLYDRLADDDEGRVCAGIDERACRAAPGNFLKTLVANTLTGAGDRVASAKTTLPWLLAQLGAPAWCTSLLVPIREAGSMVPQLWIGGFVRRRPVRKGMWVAGSVGQAAALLAMAAIALLAEGLVAGLAVVALLAGFALARALCSVTAKDVLGKTIPRTRRGRLGGWIVAVAGLAALGVGLALRQVGDGAAVGLYAGLLAGAAGLWLLAAAVYARIRETPGATDGGRSAEEALRGGWKLWREDAPLRRFTIARALAMGSGLAAPFYVTLARGELGPGAAVLGAFVAAEGLAAAIGAPLWGRWADRSARTVFAVAGALAAGLTLAVALWSWWGGAGAAAARWFYPTVFFGLGLAHAGVRLGRKTYLVDLAEGNRRTAYVAVSNTVIGGLLLGAGLIGALAAAWSIEGTLALLAAAGFVGAGLSLRWKPVGGV